MESSVGLRYCFCTIFSSSLNHPPSTSPLFLIFLEGRYTSSGSQFIRESGLAGLAGTELNEVPILLLLLFIFLLLLVLRPRGCTRGLFRSLRSRGNIRGRGRHVQIHWHEVADLHMPSGAGGRQRPAVRHPLTTISPAAATCLGTAPSPLN